MGSLESYLMIQTIHLIGHIDQIKIARIHVLLFENIKIKKKNCSRNSYRVKIQQF